MQALRRRWTIAIGRPAITIGIMCFTNMTNTTKGLDRRGSGITIMGGMTSMIMAIGHRRIATTGHLASQSWGSAERSQHSARSASGSSGRSPPCRPASTINRMRWRSFGAQPAIRNLPTHICRGRMEYGVQAYPSWISDITCHDLTRRLRRYRDLAVSWVKSPLRGLGQARSPETSNNRFLRQHEKSRTSCHHLPSHAKGRRKIRCQA